MPEGHTRWLDDWTHGIGRLENFCAYLSFLKSRSSAILKHFTCNFVTGVLKVHYGVGNFYSNGFNNCFNIKYSDQSIRKQSQIICKKKLYLENCIKVSRYDMLFVLGFFLQKFEINWTFLHRIFSRTCKKSIPKAIVIYSMLILRTA